MSEELSLSEELRRAREGRGESLDQVRQRTGISLRILQALEEGDLEAIEAVYMRMGAVHYANYLGLDGEALVQGFEGPWSKERRPARTPLPKGGPILGDGLIRWAAALAIAALAAVLYLIAGGETDPASPVVEESPAPVDPPAWEEPAAATESPEPVESGAPPVEPGDRSGPVARDASELAPASPPEATSPAPAAVTIAEEAAAPARVVLEGEAIDTVWVQVSWDDMDSAMETIPAGERRTWTGGRFFKVHAGRSGNIRFKFQGQLLGEGRLGDSDQTLRFRVSEDGYQLLGPDFQPIAPVTGFQPERTESSQPEAR